MQSYTTNKEADGNKLSNNLPASVTASRHDSVFSSVALLKPHSTCDLLVKYTFVVLASNGSMYSLTTNVCPQMGYQSMINTHPHKIKLYCSREVTTTAECIATSMSLMVQNLLAMFTGDSSYSYSWYSE